MKHGSDHLGAMHREGRRDETWVGRASIRRLRRRLPDHAAAPPEASGLQAQEVEAPDRFVGRGDAPAAHRQEGPGSLVGTKVR